MRETELTLQQAFGNNMLNIPLLFSHPDIKALAEKLSQERNEKITPTQIL